MKQEINYSEVWRNPIHFVAFGFGSGTIRFFPGSWGTLAAIPFYLLMVNLSIYLYLAIVVVAIFFGFWICHVTAHDIGVHDHSGIVWDEFVGFFITMIAAPKGWVWILLGFLLFRLFDIWKPWVIRWFDRHVQGGIGIMIDDILAGICSLIVMQIIILVFPSLT